MIKTAAYFIVIGCIAALLVLGKPVIVPFMVALLIWYLINALNDGVQRVSGERLPNWFGLTVSSFIIITILVLVGDLITRNINEVIASASSYEINLQEEIQSILVWIGFDKEISLATLAEKTNIGQYLSPLINSITSVAGSSLLILVYVIFLLIEQGTFAHKINSLRMSEERRAKLRHILLHINRAIRKYLTVKTFTSFLTAFISFFIIKAIGVNYAFFWAFLIFILNFIPTIGSIVATAFPAIQALIQFDSPSPFFLVFFVVSGVQVLVGNIVEPRLMGNSLNISPLVVIISLVFWGFLWGIVGMLLCVPITVCLIIIFAQFPSTRPVAVLLSRTGEVDLPVEKKIIRPRKYASRDEGRGAKSEH